MKESKRFSIEDTPKSLREGIGRALGLAAGAALALSGCGASTTETTETTPTATAEESTVSTEENSATESPHLGWQVVDQNCINDDCENGTEISSVKKACDGPNLIYEYYHFYERGGIAVVPNSAECGGTSQTAEDSPSPTPVTTMIPTPAN